MQRTDADEPGLSQAQRDRFHQLLRLVYVLLHDPPPIGEQGKLLDSLLDELDDPERPRVKFGPLLIALEMAILRRSFGLAVEHGARWWLERRRLDDESRELSGVWDRRHLAFVAKLRSMVPDRKLDQWQERLLLDELERAGRVRRGALGRRLAAQDALLGGGIGISRRQARRLATTYMLM